MERGVANKIKKGEQEHQDQDRKIKIRRNKTSFQFLLNFIFISSLFPFIFSVQYYVSMPGYSPSAHILTTARRKEVTQNLLDGRFEKLFPHATPSELLSYDLESPSSRFSFSIFYFVGLDFHDFAKGHYGSFMEWTVDWRGNLKSK